MPWEIEDFKKRAGPFASLLFGLIQCYKNPKKSEVRPAYFLCPGFAFVFLG